jgi:acyl carrier protein
MEAISAEQLRDTVVDAFCSACACERSQLTPATPLLDLGLDSLNLSTVLAQVDATYALDLSDQELFELLRSDTVGDLIQRVFTAVTRNT